MEVHVDTPQLHGGLIRGPWFLLKYEGQVERGDAHLVPLAGQTVGESFVPQATPAMEVTRAGYEEADAQGSNHVTGAELGGNVLRDQAVDSQKSLARQANHLGVLGDPTLGPMPSQE